MHSEYMLLMAAAGKLGKKRWLCVYIYIERERQIDIDRFIDRNPQPLLSPLLR